MTITVISTKDSDVVAIERGPNDVSTIPMMKDLRSYLAANDLSVFTVTKNESLMVSAELAATREILAALRPDEETEEEFEEEVVDDRIHEVSAMGSVRINGEEWGWLRDDQGWKPAPRGDGIEVARMSAWMSASMTGASITAGIRTWANDTAMVWFDDDESNPEGDVVELKYAVEDWHSLALRLHSLLGDWFDIHCPYCDEGWEIEGSFDERFSVESIGQVVARTWEPCKEHLNEIHSGDSDIEFGGHSWRWAGGRWNPV